VSSSNKTIKGRDTDKLASASRPIQNKESTAYLKKQQLSTSPN
tara:strand:- start:4821 stop:4949 length:129 start_codon:yes stop_codon:yes gene_type:complete